MPPRACCSSSTSTSESMPESQPHLCRIFLQRVTARAAIAVVRNQRVVVPPGQGSGAAVPEARPGPSRPGRARGLVEADAYCSVEPAPEGQAEVPRLVRVYDLRPWSEASARWCQVSARVL